MKNIVLVIALLAHLPLNTLAQETSAGITTVIGDLVDANKILAAKGILPGYGHVSVRHPDNPMHYFLSRAIAPELVTADDIIEFDLESVAIDSKGYSFYLERFIHGEIYKARPDVQAVVHNHTPAVISFGIGPIPLRPVFHMADFFLSGIPTWDYRDFGTAADAPLVNNPAKGRGLAESLSDSPAALMRNHGVVVVGSSLPMVVGRSITLEENAQIQSQALSRGDEIIYLELDEETLDSVPTRNYTSFARAWNLWKQQISNEGR